MLSAGHVNQRRALGNTGYAAAAGLSAPRQTDKSLAGSATCNLVDLVTIVVSAARICRVDLAFLLRRWRAGLVPPRWNTGRVCIRSTRLGGFGGRIPAPVAEMSSGQ